MHSVASLVFLVFVSCAGADTYLTTIVTRIQAERYPADVGTCRHQLLGRLGSVGDRDRTVLDPLRLHNVLASLQAVPVGHDRLLQRYVRTVYAFVKLALFPMRSVDDYCSMDALDVVLMLVNSFATTDVDAVLAHALYDGFRRDPKWMDVLRNGTFDLRRFTDPRRLFLEMLCFLLKSGWNLAAERNVLRFFVANSFRCGFSYKKPLGGGTEWPLGPERPFGPPTLAALLDTDSTVVPDGFGHLSRDEIVELLQNALDDQGNECRNGRDVHFAPEVVDLTSDPTTTLASTSVQVRSTQRTSGMTTEVTKNFFDDDGDEVTIIPPNLLSSSDPAINRRRRQVIPTYFSWEESSHDQIDMELDFGEEEGPQLDLYQGNAIGLDGTESTDAFVQLAVSLPNDEMDDVGEDVYQAFVDGLKDTTDDFVVQQTTPTINKPGGSGRHTYYVNGVARSATFWYQQLEMATSTPKTTATTKKVSPDVPKTNFINGPPRLTVVEILKRFNVTSQRLLDLEDAKPSTNVACPPNYTKVPHVDVKDLLRALNASVSDRNVEIFTKLIKSDLSAFPVQNYGNMGELLRDLLETALGRHKNVRKKEIIGELLKQTAGSVGWAKPPALSYKCIVIATQKP